MSVDRLSNKLDSKTPIKPPRQKLILAYGNKILVMQGDPDFANDVPLQKILDAGWEIMSVSPFVNSTGGGNPFGAYILLQLRLS